jgi:hypothetical protein
MKLNNNITGKKKQEPDFIYEVPMYPADGMPVFNLQFDICRNGDYARRFIRCAYYWYSIHRKNRKVLDRMINSAIEYCKTA